jgi:hypothetical protein
MKKLCFILFLLVSSGPIYSLDVDDVTKVIRSINKEDVKKAGKVGKDALKTSKETRSNHQASENEKKIFELEAELKYCKRRVADLEYQLQNTPKYPPSHQGQYQPPPPPKRNHVYYIKSRAGTHIGKSESRAEARAIALKKCTDAVGSFWCDEKDLKSDDD